MKVNYEHQEAFNDMCDFFIQKCLEMTAHPEKYSAEEIERARAEILEKINKVKSTPVFVEE